MNPIELELWRPKDDDPRYAERAGQRSGVEVFEELKQRLDGMGLLPDEYFDLDMDWEGGKLIPSGADIFVTTDYGESEGIYLDLYLKWYEDGKPVTSRLAIGKTLGETGADMDRMFLISSAITKAFHGDHGEYARYVKLGPQEKGGDIVVNLTPAEQRLFIDALIERREKMLGAVDDTEKLLRRMTGSITAYMDLVGERPLHISDFDKAMLAIRDSELEAFRELRCKVPSRADELLIEAAGHAGAAGRKMTLELVTYTDLFTKDAYLRASQNAAGISDTERVKFLMEQAQNRVEDFDIRYYGQVIGYAYTENAKMGRSLIDYAPDEWIAAAPPDLLLRTSSGNKDFRTMSKLVEKGLQPGTLAAGVLQNLTGDKRDVWMAEDLLRHGMTVAQDDYRALNVCVKNGAISASKLLLDQGMDFDSYLAWNEKHDRHPAPEGVIEELTQYAQTLSQRRQEQATAPEEAPAQGQAFGGMQ